MIDILIEYREYLPFVLVFIFMTGTWAVMTHRDFNDKEK